MERRPVLVVDDDPDIRKLIEHVLRSEGHAVVTATNGREALDRLLAVNPSVVLLDLDMPVMDGRTFCECQRRLPEPFRSVPVIVWTGEVRAHELTETLRPFACLSKPLPDFAPLLEKVDAACEQNMTAIFDTSDRRASLGSPPPTA